MGCPLHKEGEVDDEVITGLTFGYMGPSSIMALHRSVVDTRCRLVHGVTVDDQYLPVLDNGRLIRLAEEKLVGGQIT